MLNTANVTERTTDWHNVNWRNANRMVRNLRRRIFRATQNGNWRKVRNLQRLMLRSYSNVLLSVRRATQENQGKRTAGVDRVLVKTPQQRGKLADDLAKHQDWTPKPARRVYIPKPNGSKRPLGIPTIRDRCLQAIVKNALEPCWEAQFEGVSYGFRPGRRLIEAWLKAGYVDNNTFHNQETGTPQGGIISPLLANIALHGLENALGVKYDHSGYSRGKRVLVRYADDFVIFCESKEDAEKAEMDANNWLKTRGLEISNEKTRIAHLTEGFDFLGFNIRHYKVSNTKTGYKLLIKPSQELLQRTRKELREISLDALTLHLSILESLVDRDISRKLKCV